MIDLFPPYFFLSPSLILFFQELKKDPRNYDTWFDYIRMEESNGDIEKIRDVYERAIAQVPPALVSDEVFSFLFF